MKTLYLIKSVLPFLFLPLAPGVLQLELARQGFLTGSWAICVIAGQGIVTLATIAWMGLIITRQRQKAFLRMSCVSKKVFCQGRWMTVESYLAEHHNIQVSHAMTPEESQAWLAEAQDYIREQSAADDMATAPLPEVMASAGVPQYHQSAA